MSSKLYIANTSKHVQEVQYWVAESARPFSQTIGIGQQELIYNTPRASLTDHTHIVEQLERYGLVDVRQIGRNKAYAGLCFQFDKPINIDAIASGMAHNDEAMETVSIEERKKGAAALHRTANEATGGKVAEVELEVIEQVKQGSDANTTSESISVASEGRAPRKGNKGN